MATINFGPRAARYRGSRLHADARAPGHRLGGHPADLPGVVWRFRQTDGPGRGVGLREARDGGVQTMIDLTTLDLGRDVRLQADVSRRTGVNIIAATGIWRDIPRALWTRSPDEIAGAVRARDRARHRGDGHQGRHHQSGQRHRRRDARRRDHPARGGSRGEPDRRVCFDAQLRSRPGWGAPGSHLRGRGTRSQPRVYRPQQRLDRSRLPAGPHAQGRLAGDGPPRDAARRSGPTPRAAPRRWPRSSRPVPAIG